MAFFHIDIFLNGYRKVTVMPQDDEIAAYRQRILGLVEDCLEVLTPNTALEHVLKSLLSGQQQGVVVPRWKFRQMWRRCEATQTAWNMMELPKHGGLILIFAHLSELSERRGSVVAQPISS